jgi:hypothetical protein
MKLAFSTNAYTRHSLVDALRGIRKAGFEGVEMKALRSSPTSRTRIRRRSTPS